MVLVVESYYDGIALGIELDYPEKRFSLVLVFWVLHFIITD